MSALETRPAEPLGPSGRTILFICNDLPYFLAHRRHLADRLMRDGHRVVVATAPADAAARQAAAGMTLESIPLERHRLSPRDGGLMLAALRLVRTHDPAAVHLITIKPSLFAGLALSLAMRAGRIAPRPVIATFPGLGRVFQDEEDGRAVSPLGTWRRRVVLAGLRTAFAHGHMHATFENPADTALFVTQGVVPQARAHLVMGTGLDLDAFRPQPRPPGPFTALFASRLLISKGVTLFVEAARRLRARRPEMRFLIAGWAEPGRPDSLTERELARIAREPGIELLGNVHDMAALFAQTDVVCLPTRYPEGLPRVLIEAAACARPAIVSGQPGCRAVVTHDETGLILDRLDAERLAEAIAELADAPARRTRMAEAARRFVENHGFSERAVQDAFLALYFPARGSVPPQRTAQ